MSKFLGYLKKYDNDLQPVLDRFFDEQKKKVSSVAEEASELVEDYKQFLVGGKKLRGALTLLGYGMYGGKDKKSGLLASLATEILHAALLIHDDVMDQDDLRRGKPTMHKTYSQMYGDHFGNSMAIDIGDEGIFLSFYLLNSLDFPKERLSKAIEIFSNVLMKTGFGQALDLLAEKRQEFNEDIVLKIHHHKTAEYTIAGPLSMGTILAGASEKHLTAIKNFGIPVGVAFQLRDDELGMFSTEQELGKPIGSDIRGSKVTLLISKALELASDEDRKFLESAYGNSKITEEEIERVKDIVKKSGALEYSQNLSRKLVEKGKQFIPQITDDPRYQRLLSELADLGIERTS